VTHKHRGRNNPSCRYRKQSKRENSWRYFHKGAGAAEQYRWAEVIWGKVKLRRSLAMAETVLFAGVVVKKGRSRS
jgi:hypothetical protein